MRSCLLVNFYPHKSSVSLFLEKEKALTHFLPIPIWVKKERISYERWEREKNKMRWEFVCSFPCCREPFSIRFDFWLNQDDDDGSDDDDVASPNRRVNERRKKETFTDREKGNVGHKWTVSAIFLHLCWAWLTVRLLEKKGEKEKAHSHFRPWLRDDVMFFLFSLISFLRLSLSLFLSCVVVSTHCQTGYTPHSVLVVVCRQYLHSHKTRILFLSLSTHRSVSFGVLDSLVYCIREKKDHC